MIKNFFAPPPVYKLSAEEERELLLRSQNGDKEARDTLIAYTCKHLYNEIQKKYFSYNVEVQQELFQEGILLMMSEIEKCKLDPNTRFSTYFLSVWKTVRSTVLFDVLRMNIPYTFPSWLWFRIRQAKQFSSEFYKEHGRMPSGEQIKEKLKLGDVEFVNLMQYMYTFDLTSTPPKTREDSDEEQDDVADMVDASVDIAEHIQTKLDAGNVIRFVNEYFNDRDAYVFNHYYGVNGKEAKQVKDICDELGISRPTVHNILKRIQGVVRGYLHIA